MQNVELVISNPLEKHLKLTTTKTQQRVKGGLLLDVVVGHSMAFFQLFTGKDQTLLVWEDSLLVLDLGFDVLDSVGRLNFQGDGLACQGLHKDLHA